ncbi:hypothetical protein [Pseudogemmobacter bohemicus]|uniref:hypothetical protein n=1 Tax=Pseudogemmobacter bohemicus TaxID=2250708 RepID=UPI000DD362BD|nr:hypothetical protein [Pseudogemmobacter bohemicus]
MGAQRRATDHLAVDKAVQEISTWRLVGTALGQRQFHGGRHGCCKASFADHADRAGVSIVPAEAFATGARSQEAVRISLGVAPDRGVLEEGLLQLAALLERPPVSTRTVV